MLTLDELIAAAAAPGRSDAAPNMVVLLFDGDERYVLFWNRASAASCSAIIADKYVWHTADRRSADSGSGAISQQRTHIRMQSSERVSSSHVRRATKAVCLSARPPSSAHLVRILHVLHVVVIGGHGDSGDGGSEHC